MNLWKKNAVVVMICRCDEDYDDEDDLWEAQNESFIDLYT